MRRKLVVTGPVLAALLLVVVIEAVVTHALAHDSSALVHAALAAVHVSALVWLVMQLAAARRDPGAQGPTA